LTSKRGVYVVLVLSGNRETQSLGNSFPANPDIIPVRPGLPSLLT